MHMHTYAHTHTYIYMCVSQDAKYAGVTGREICASGRLHTHMRKNA